MFTLKIETENALFADDYDGGAGQLDIILHNLAQRLEDGLGSRDQGGEIRDENDNTIGSWEWPR